MFNLLKKYLSAPTFDDEAKTRSAQYLNAILPSIAGVIVIWFIVGLIFPETAGGDLTQITFLSLAAFCVVLWIVMRFGYVNQASIGLVVGAWALLSYQAFTHDFTRDSSTVGFLVVVIVAGLLLGWRGILGLIALSILSTWVLAIGEVRIGRDIYYFDTPAHYARDYTVFLSVGAIAMYLTLNNMTTMIKKLKTNEKTLTETNQQLTSLSNELENRVAQRTIELEDVSFQNEKRARQLEAVAEVSRDIATVRDSESLVQIAVDRIGQQFKCYHVAIYLLDDRGDYVVMRAANSRGGKRKIDTGYKVSVEPGTTIGFTVFNGIPRIALDVGINAVFFNDPDLPETRSEIVLPLRIGDNTFGALDLQSNEPNAYKNEDIALFLTLSNQLSIALQNARLFEETNRALAESRALYQQYVGEEWTRFSRQLDVYGYRYDGAILAELASPVDAPEIKAAVDTSSLSASNGKDGKSVAIPIKLRGQVIGVINARVNQEGRQLSQDELALLQSAADRAALALENARLFQETSRRAARDRAVSNISSRLSASINTESILKTTVEALGQLISNAEVVLQLKK
jgi:GAF domain-containing protein